MITNTLKYIAILLLFPFLCAAQNADKFETSSTFQKQLSEVYQTNLDLTQSFVASNADQVKESAKKVKDALSQVDMKELQGDAHQAWMNDVDKLNETLVDIAAASDMEAQRKSFGTWNLQFYQTLKAFGVNGETVYYQFCPMANESKGAYWLSNSKEIQNPYFGEKMLKCGSVKDVLND